MNTESNVLNSEIISGKVFDKSTNYKYDRITGYNKTDLPFRYGVPVNDEKGTKKYHIIEPIQNRLIDIMCIKLENIKSNIKKGVINNGECIKSIINGRRNINSNTNIIFSTKSFSNYFF